MPKKPTTALGTKESYNRFIAEVNLYALGLDSVQAILRREAYALAHAERAAPVLRVIENGFELVAFTQDHFDVCATFNLRVRLQASADKARIPTPPAPEATSSKEPEDLLSIKTVFTAHFHCDKVPLGKRHATRFAKAEARLVFWPYFRQIVSDTTARMSIRPITIPLVL